MTSLVVLALNFNGLDNLTLLRSNLVNSAEQTNFK